MGFREKIREKKEKISTTGFKKVHKKSKWNILQPRK